MRPFQRAAMLAVVAALVLPGCTKVNPLFCEAPSDCPPGFTCDQLRKQCLAPADASNDGAACESASCPVATPVCGVGGGCETCVLGTAGDTACAERDAMTSICRADGLCVECLDDDDCTTGERLFCDTASGMCRGCLANDECSSEVCSSALQTCADPDGILYVDKDNGTDSSTCGAQNDPCQTIGGNDGALPKVNPGQRIIRVRAAASAYTETLTLDAVATVIVGDGATLRPIIADMPAITVQNGANVTIEGLTITGATGSANGDGVICSGTDTIVRLDRVHILENASLGVDAAATCDVRIIGSVIQNNANGGVRLLTNSFEIVNSVIIGNGGSGSAIGGILLQSTGSGKTRKLEFNAIANNEKSSTARAAGVQCDVDGLDVSNNIIWGNTGSGQVGGACSWTYSDIQGGETGNGNIDMDPMFVSGEDFHLQSGSPCIEAGDPTATLLDDIDRDVRPQGATRDIGADEVKN